MYKNKIKEYREEKGLTLRDVASRSGISIGYLWHLEKGKRDNPSTEVMEKIANTLDKTIPEVFFSS